MSSIFPLVFQWTFKAHRYWRKIYLSHIYNHLLQNILEHVFFNSQNNSYRYFFAILKYAYSSDTKLMLT